MIKIIDLHTHTDSSDGIYSPIELIDHAARNNIVAMAITDHDTVDGLKDASEYAKKINFNLIPGIELSIEYSGGSFHLLGLFIDFENLKLLKTIKKLKRNRENRAQKIVKDLRNYDVNISFDEVKKGVRNGSIGKPHIARIMVKMGYGQNVTEIFHNYMRKGKPGYVKKGNLEITEAISVIKQAGGTPIIAHPASLNYSSYNEFDNILRDSINAGVEGLEVYSSMHSLDETQKFLEIAKKYNILISGGSDFHGDKGKEIGSYYKEKYIPIEILDKIIEYRNDNRFQKSLVV